MPTRENYREFIRKREEENQRGALLESYIELVYKSSTSYEVERVRLHAQAFGGGVHQDPKFTDAVADKLKKLQTD